MTQSDNWQPEVARLTQRQDQLERQQRETSTRVDSLKRDVDTVNRDIDRSRESVRRDIESQFMDREWRVSSLERFRDFIKNLMMYGMMIGTAVALVILYIIIIVDARDERRERAEPEEQPLSSMTAPYGDQTQLYFLPGAGISTAPEYLRCHSDMRPLASRSCPGTTQSIAPVSTGMAPSHPRLISP